MVAKARNAVAQSAAKHSTNSTVLRLVMPPHPPLLARAALQDDRVLRKRTAGEQEERYGNLQAQHSGQPAPITPMQIWQSHQETLRVCKTVSAPFSS
jgi:hypothetical protein